MWLRSILLPALGLALSAGVAVAQEPSPSHIAAARELVNASGALGSIDRILPAIVEEIRRQAITRPEMTKDLDEVLKLLGPEVELQRQQAILLTARSYAKYMSEPEIRDTTAFFLTPVGAKYVRVQPDLTDDIVNAITNWSQIAAEYVMTRTRAEMTKRGQQMQ